MSLELAAWIGLSAVILWVSRTSLRHVRSHGFYRFLAWEAIAALIALNLRRWFADPFSPPQLLSWPSLLASLLLAVILWVSRTSLRHVRSHGFYRFLAWEAIATLIALNLRHWFADPFSPPQLLSWPSLLASLLLAVHGFRSLSRVGKPDGVRDDPALVGLEKTTELVTVGAYRYIRHPLYSSLLFLTWGAFLKSASWLGLALGLLATMFLTATAKVEEAENKRYFGAAYESYMRTTKMFIPFVF